MTKQSVVALIPARAGSKRVPGKNVRSLAGHPLLAYAIACARESAVFRDVIVSTDSLEVAEIARYYGGEVPGLRPTELAADLSPDIDWVEYVLRDLKSRGREYDAFSILRPTNPFRLPATVARAWRELISTPGVDSLRAVEKCKQHPGKMWVVRGQRLIPLLPVQPESPPWHSTPYQALPEIYVQNAALEIAWSRCVWETRSIAGVSLMPFFLPDHEGFDINDAADWARAEKLAAESVALPSISTSPFRG